MPKNVKVGTIWAFNIYSVAKYQKTRKGDSFETLKYFRKKSHNAEQNRKGDPFALISADRTWPMVVVLVVSIVKKWPNQSEIVV